MPKKQQPPPATTGSSPPPTPESQQQQQQHVPQHQKHPSPILRTHLREKQKKHILKSPFLSRNIQENSSSGMCNNHFRIRRIPSQNVVSRLHAREIFGSKFRRAGLDTNRGFYTNVFPNYTLVNVEKPPCYLRKFTPDGKRFIAFSQCQTQLEVYVYKGPSALGKLVHHSPDDNDHLSEGTPYSHKIRSVAFDTFFTLEHSIQLTVFGGQQLNRECSLFSEDGDFVIIGSAQFIPEDRHPRLWETMQNNEAVSPNPRNPLEGYTLYSVEISEGILVDKIVFDIDKIFLSHNQGLYLHRDTFAVLSIQHQTIHVFRFSNGRFTPVMNVGRNLFEDDSYILSATLTADQQMSLPGNFSYEPYREQTINCLKHRLLVFLYKR